MKRIQRVFIFGAIFSITALILGISAMSYQAEAKTKVVTTKNGTKLYCYSDKGKNYEIYKIKNAKKDLIIPETVDGKHKITGIMFESQKTHKKVNRIHFPSGMKSLANYCDDEGYVYNAFWAFPNLEKVSFAKKNVHYSAKDGKVYSKSGKKKELAAIAPGISHVTIESWVTSIWPGAFSDLTKLEEISVEEGNRKYKSIEGVLYSKDGSKLILYPVAKKDEVFQIPDGVKTVERSACFEQKYLKEIVMSDSVYKIGEYAFAWCTRLKKVTLNEGLKILEDGAFYNKNWISLSLPAGIEEVEIGTLPVKELEIPAGCKKVRLEVDQHSEQTWLRAKTLIVRSLSLDLIKMDRNYCNEIQQGYIEEGSVYSGKTICAYEDSKAYKQLKKIAKKYKITLKLLD